MIPDPVFTLDAAKAHLRVTHNEEDALITAMLDAAVGAVERYTRRAWTEREWSVMLDASDIAAARADSCACGCNSCGRSPSRPDSAVFHALLSPASAEVFGFDSGGNDVAVACSIGTQFGHTVVIVPQWTAPTVEAGNVGRIDYSAAPDFVPPDVVAAVMLYLGDLYETREAQVIGTIVAQNHTAETILAPYVVDLYA